MALDARQTLLVQMSGVHGPSVAVDGGTLSVTFPTVSVIAADDIGAARQGTGGHTLYGAGIPTSQTHYWWVTVDGIGADPALDGMTGVEVQLSGSGPFTGAAVATAAETAASGLGYSLTRTDDTIEISGNGINAESAAAIASGLTAFVGRGGGRVLGSLDNSFGNSVGSNSTGWMQVDPADVPAGPFRVIGFELYRGSDVTDGVRMGVASGGAADGDPEGCVVAHQRTMGDSGTNTLHREWLAHDEVVEYSGGERLWIGLHGNNTTSSILGHSNVNAGTYEDGSANNLWLTDGTTGDTTPIVSPAGSVTSSFDFGVIARVIVQIAPYQDDGAYRVIAGAIPGVHDQDLFEDGTEAEDIFVGWGITVPNISGLALHETWVNFQAHASGASNQKRLELWTVGAGGSTTFVGDTLVSHIGTTQDDQGTGWTSVQSVGPIALTPGGDYRYTIKGTVSTGVVFEVDVGGAGVGALAPAYALSLTSPTSYPITDTLEDGELEVLGPSNFQGDETAIVFDPQTATASPNAANGTVVYPGNIGMIALYVGTTAPTVVAVQ